jgi:hypothetical protein
MAEMKKCTLCGSDLVLLKGRFKFRRLDQGKAYACPTCDGPDKPQGQKTIIELSKENAS